MVDLVGGSSRRHENTCLAKKYLTIFYRSKFYKIVDVQYWSFLTIWILDPLLVLYLHEIHYLGLSTFIAYAPNVISDLNYILYPLTLFIRSTFDLIVLLSLLYLNSVLFVVLLDLLS